ncbi:hypothetical protein PF327_11240 [Sulfurovum sp. XTW-4]|uniref:Uncharacterized protein n=1 Tax=Sulfurovum xiamenensis TaxID=3019066 RepID=A0ABT7QW38_9BACT|nr:hypothetical protein [Sulfurovum xiamenensis]MDM5264769.1 hypothetical protein [Sulfurovum xiamenensis]
MDKQQRKELFRKLKTLPKSVQNTLTVSHLARHIKVMKGLS